LARAKARFEKQREVFKGPSKKAKGLRPQLSWDTEKKPGNQTMRDMSYLTKGKQFTPQGAMLNSRKARNKLTSKEKGKIITSEIRRKKRDTEKRARAAVEAAYKKEAIEEIQAKVKDDEDEKEKKAREIEEFAKSLDIGIGKNPGKSSLPPGPVLTGGKTRRRKRKRRRKTKKKKKRRRRTKKKKNKKRRRTKKRRRK
jgi:hypothetical protein